MEFTSLTELNNFVNKSESNIESIDVKNFTASTSSNKRTLNVMREEVKYPCYIIFNDKESYLEQKETLTITTDLHSINAIQTNITLSKFNELKQNVKFIEFIDLDEKSEALGVMVNGEYYSDLENWGAKIANVKSFWDRGITGAGVKVAVIDTMFYSEPNYLNFKEHVIFNGTSLNPHGQNVASVISAPLNNKSIVGIAYGCDIYALETSLLRSATNAAQQWCIDNNIDIINASYGFKTTSTTASMMLAAVIEHGIIFVAGAGNNGEYEHFFPADADGVITVGAVSDHGNLDKVNWDPPYGGRNQPWVDFLFAGTAVPFLDSNENVVYAGSGTSLSTPAIAGIFALLKEEYPNKTKDELIEVLKKNSCGVYGRYGKFPLFDMVDNSVVENRIAKVNKDGSLQIKGEIIIEDDCERVRFDKDGNLYLKSYFTGLTQTSENFQFKITKNTVSARFIVENSEI